MLILIILGVLIVACVTLIVLDLKIWDTDIGVILGIIGGVILGVAFIVISIIGIEVQCFEEQDYQQKLYERQVLEYRVSQIDENVTGNELVYADVVEFNNELRKCKLYHDSLWVGIFYNDKVATLDYIVIGDISYE